MAQYKLEVHQIEINGCNEEMFKTFLDIDSDFHDDSDRLSKELFEKFKEHFEDGYIEGLSAALEHASYMSDNEEDGSCHIVGNDTYTADSDISIICMDDHANEYIVIVSLMLKA